MSLLGEIVPPGRNCEIDTLDDSENLTGFRPSLQLKCAGVAALGQIETRGSGLMSTCPLDSIARAGVACPARCRGYLSEKMLEFAMTHSHDVN